MDIIKETEAQPRNIYTGTFGWLAPGRQAHFNVAIRTALIDRHTNQAVYGVGAGITWDSAGEDEYRECLDKAIVLTRAKEDFALIETLRWTPGKGYFILNEHLERLQSSAEYFDFRFDRAQTEAHLKTLSRKLPASPQRIRLLLDRDGKLETSYVPMDSSPKSVATICFAKQAVSSANILLFHKTTQRKLYEQNQADAPGGVDEVVLWNERGEVTEGCITNLVIEKQGRLVTPALSCGLLPGTYRDYLLKKGVIEEAIVTKEDLRTSPRIFLINAVRKWRRANLALSNGDNKKRAPQNLRDPSD